MKYKRVLSIQDVSCFGQCSNTVALPIISACGHECAIIPSAVLSTHTAGFEGFTCKDLGEEIPKIGKHWEERGIKFDCIYTGYLGSSEMVKSVAQIMRTSLKDNSVKIVDPAMADNGKLYPAFNSEYVDAMKWLCSQADIILPNITEACFLTGVEYKENYDQEYVQNLLMELDKLCGGCIILTGVSFKPEKTGVMIYEAGFCSYYEHDKINQNYHGTGDVFSSVFVGSMMCDVGAVNAACVAADFTVDSIKATIGDDEHWYGVKFEPQLKELIKTLTENNEE